MQKLERSDRITLEALLIAVIAAILFIGPWVYFDLKTAKIQKNDFEKHFNLLTQAIQDEHFIDGNSHNRARVMATNTTADLLEEISKETKWRYLQYNLVTLRHQGNIRVAKLLLNKMWWEIYPPDWYQCFLAWTAEKELTWKKLDLEEYKVKHNFLLANLLALRGTVDRLEKGCGNWDHEVNFPQNASNLIGFIHDHQYDKLSHLQVNNLVDLDERFAKVAKKCQRKIPPHTLDP